MTDRVTRAEVEDLLSSVRRLVATDPNRVPSRMTGPQEKKDAYMLTSDHRIAEAGQNEPQPREGEKSAHEKMLEARIAELEAVIMRQTKGLNEDTPPEQGSHRPAVVDGQPVEERDLAVPMAPLRLNREERFNPNEMHNIAYDLARAFRLPDQPKDPSSEPQAEATIAPDHIPSHGDAPNGADAAVAAVLQKDQRGTDEHADKERLQENDDSHVVKPTEQGAADEELVAPVEFKSAAAPKEVAAAPADTGAIAKAQNTGDTKPLPVQDEDKTPVAPEQASDLEQSTGQDLEPEANPEAVEDIANETDILDESSLRNLISEILKEELRGELGIRITRNVRKLVQQEIAKALTVDSVS